jgi:hypothetical protein
MHLGTLGELTYICLKTPYSYPISLLVMLLFHNQWCRDGTQGIVCAAATRLPLGAR